MRLEKIEYVNYQHKKGSSLDFASIIHQHKLDNRMMSKILKLYYTLQVSDKSEMNETTIEILYFLEYAFKKVDLSERQKKFLKMYMSGHTYKEIADYYTKVDNKAVKHQSVGETIQRAVEKLILELYRMEALDSKCNISSI
jgi:hypothetical protein